MSFLKSGLDALLGQVLLRLGLEDASQLSLEKVCRLERPDLLDLGRRIGLETDADADTSETAERIWLALQAALVTDAPVDHPEPTDAATDDIPWGYGQNRVTGIAVDPNRLYVYWEVTDEAIAAARRGLEAGGDQAWLGLRIYDTSGRLFDGTNAHGYVDHKVDREDRQWFVDINKPGSEVFIEVGMKSLEGYFVKIARSGRVEFPRWGIAATDAPEWMTVRVQPGGIDTAPGGHGHPTAGGHAAGGHAAGSQASGSQASGSQAAGGPTGDGPAADDNVSGGDAGAAAPPAAGGVAPAGPQAQAGAPVGTVATETHAWTERGERVHTTHTRAWERRLGSWSWESGPYRYPLNVPGAVTERFVGGRQVHRIGERTHVVYGPWEVVIRGIDAHMEKAVLGRWETFRSWVTEEGHEVTRVVDGSAIEGAPGAGSSERLFAGASERSWGAGSEARLGGASEAWRLGASERMLGGASEYSYLAASERMLRGASERLLMGSSERLLQGASEQRFGGASEQQLFGGASDRLAGGASERRFPPLPPELEESH